VQKDLINSKIIIMRKIYLLSSLVLFLFCKANSQDTANFTYTIGISNQVIFTNTSHLHGDAYRKAVWTFGDGVRQSTTVLGNAFYQYNVAGTYTVCLHIYRYSTTSNDSVLTSEACKTFTISNNDSPDSCSASFETISSAANSLTFAFVAKPWHNHQKRPEEICWKFGDGKDTCIKYDPTLSNNYAVYHIFSQRGQYNVCVRIRYQGGCISEYCHVITIGTDECKADFTADTITVSPLTKHFVAQPWDAFGKKPLRICWDFGDGATECKQYSTTSTDLFAINHTYAKGGQYNVCVSILYDGGCESKKCKTVIIETLPPRVDTCFANIFEVATNVNNFVRHFYAGITPNHRPERICWSFGDGKDTCISLPNPLVQQSLLIEHRYAAPGVYRVCVRIKYAGGCEAEKCREVAIRSLSDICGGYMTDSLTGGRTFAFKGYSIQNSNDHVVAWRWTFGDGSSANDQSVIHSYERPGNYEVCLYIKTDLGCETRICRHIVAQGETKPTLVLTPNPVTTTLHATFLSILQEQVTVNIYNANGVLIKTYSRFVVNGTNTWEFDVSSLTPGIYSVIVSSTHQLANAIFFKQ